MKLQYSLRTIFVTVVLFALAVSILVLLRRKVQYEIADNYAQWDTAGMIVRYLDTHDGEWPRNWDALKPWYEENARRVSWPFERYKSRIFIDFNAEANELRAAALSNDRATFDVVHAKYKLTRFVEIAPNEIIYRYFRNRDGRTNDQRETSSH